MDVFITAYYIRFQVPTSALDNKAQVFVTPVPESVHSKPFPPRTESDTGWVEPSPTGPACCFPARSDADRHHESLPLCVSGQGRSVEWGGEHANKREEGGDQNIPMRRCSYLLFTDPHAGPLWSGLTRLCQRWVHPPVGEERANPHF